MSWYCAIRHNPTYLKCYFTEITNLLVNFIVTSSHEIINHGHF